LIIPSFSLSPATVVCYHKIYQPPYQLPGFYPGIKVIAIPKRRNECYWVH
jgi:hypothetical protein